MCLKTSFMNAEVRFEPLSERISAGKERQQKIFRRASATDLDVMFFILLSGA